MKVLLQLTTCFICFLFAEKSSSQNAPVWVKDINAYPDSSDVFPVSLRNDAGNHYYVLSTYSKGTGPQTKNKIYLRKHDAAGIPAWTLIFDNGGIGQPRGFDMATDTAGNCYIAGGFMGTASFKPLLIKVNPAGSVVWQRDSTTAFNTGNYSKIVMSHNKLYLLGTAGLAQFDFNGNEMWSNALSAAAMAVDHAGQVIFSAYVANPNTIFRCDSNGVMNFSAASILARRIAIDADNSFYLLAHTPAYGLAKFDSSGTFLWSDSLFPAAPPFGDIGMEVLCDDNKDVILVGLSDTMYKYSPNGTRLWTRAMYGLDSYQLTAAITSNNLLAVGGTVPGGNGYDMYISWFDLNGIQNWAGLFSSNDSLTEFTQDMVIDNSGVYVVENNDNKTSFVKFQTPFASTVVDFSKVCIDSVWYDAGNHNYYNVRAFNGNVKSIDYPTIRMVSVFSDTTGNPFDQVSVLSHPGNAFQVYHDTITDPFITNFYPYTFFMEDNSGSSLNQVGWCITLGINETVDHMLNIYPNPVVDMLFIKNTTAVQELTATIYSSLGTCVYNVRLAPDPLTQVDVSGLTPGLYFIRVQQGNYLKWNRFVKK